MAKEVFVTNGFTLNQIQKIVGKVPTVKEVEEATEKWILLLLAVKGLPPIEVHFHKGAHNVTRIPSPLGPKEDWLIRCESLELEQLVVGAPLKDWKRFLLINSDEAFEELFPDPRKKKVPT